MIIGLLELVYVFVVYLIGLWIRSIQVYDTTTRLKNSMLHFWTKISNYSCLVLVILIDHNSSNHSRVWTANLLRSGVT